MFGLLLALSLGGTVPLPPECEPPPLRDTALLKELANLDSAFSASLDAVATWCFESSGKWTGGAVAPKKGPLVPSPTPTGDCQKAIATCDESLKTVTAKAASRELVSGAVTDLERPFRGLVYKPKRSGLYEKPSQAADCRSNARSELFQMAQSRMDLARLSSLVQNEYAAYKSWLYGRGLECKAELARKPHASKATVAVDSTKPASTPVVDAGSPAVPAVSPPASTPVAPLAPVAPVAAPTTAGTTPVAPTGTPATPAQREAALKGDWVEKWKFLAREQALLEGDRDYTLGFLASKELRACDCTRVNAAAMVRALEQKEGGEAGLALLRAEDQPNTRCVVCQLDAFPSWRARADKQCTLMNQLSDFEVERLEKSDDANGIPPRCFEATKALRKDLAAARARLAAADGGRPLVAAAPPQPAPVAIGPQGQVQPAPVTYKLAGPIPSGPVQPQPSVPVGPSLSTPPAMPVAVPPSSDPLQPAKPAMPLAAPAPLSQPTGPGIAPNAAGTDSFVAPQAWAPIPQREEGRLYVRLSMSAACVAEVLPGPMQARTGDLLLLPWNTTTVQVKSPCGGLAEIYFGREAKPRHSEVFTKAQPIRFEFRTQ